MQLRLLVLTGCLLAASSADAQKANSGFTLDRYEPTPAGEWSFWVDHPWYTRSRFFAAAGFTLDYAHDPLVFGTLNAGGFRQTQIVVEHQLLGHVDVAASFLDRVTASLSLPITLLERGSAAAGAAPIGGAAMGDPRLGAMVRLYHQPLRDAFSLHAGATLWIPISAGNQHAGDSSVRFAPKVVAAGLTHRILWSSTLAFQYRPDASLGTLAPGNGNTVGSELQLGLAIGYADVERRFAVGPEAMLATTVTGGNAFARATSSVELLVGGHYNVIRQIEVGAAIGLGLLGEPGTPDVRFLFRAAYAPWRLAEPAKIARVEPAPTPPSDRDRDGVIDELDRCPDVPAGPRPDPKQPGCPLKDTDGDGVTDDEDECPEVPAGPHPDCKRSGCPDKDSDGDGVFDCQDKCPSAAAGLHPDPEFPGCALADRDGDQIPDDTDACPDTPGAPDPDPKKNGCPGLVEIKNGQIVILKPVFFATDKDVILAKSFPVLQAVANALIAQPEIKHVLIEGHTDNRGKPDHNRDLSDRRAHSVMQWLVEHDLTPERLEAKGYGPDKPVSDNRTAAGRAANRRVEFRIVDGSAPAAVP